LIVLLLFKVNGLAAEDLTPANQSPVLLDTTAKCDLLALGGAHRLRKTGSEGESEGENRDRKNLREDTKLKREWRRARRYYLEELDLAKVSLDSEDTTTSRGGADVHHQHLTLLQLADLWQER